MLVGTARRTSGGSTREPSGQVSLVAAAGWAGGSIIDRRDQPLIRPSDGRVCAAAKAERPAQALEVLTA